MGRPSKLDERTKAEVLRRLALGEKPSALRKEYKLSETTFRRNFSAGASKVQEVGTALARAEMALAELPISAQVSARSLADQLKGISNSLAKSAESGARVSAALSGMAERHTERLAQRMEEEGALMADELKPVAALVETANRAATVGLGLMQANKDANKGHDKPTLEDLITGGK